MIFKELVYVVSVSLGVIVALTLGIGKMFWEYKTYQRVGELAEYTQYLEEHPDSRCATWNYVASKPICVETVGEKKLTELRSKNENVLVK